MKKTKKVKSDLSFLKKVWIKIRYGMVLQVIGNRIAKLGFEVAPYYWFMEGAGSLKAPEIKGNVDDYMIKFLEPDDMKEIAKSNTGYSEAEFLVFLEAGERCLAMVNGDKIATFMWISLNKCNFKSITIPMKSKEAYLWNMFTVESFRGKNIAPYLRYKSYEILREMGRNTLYSISLYFNSPAIKFKQKLNAKFVKLGLYLRLFNKFTWNLTLKTYC